MDQRHEFVRLALQEGANRRELCRRFNISPDVGYKWLARWQSGDRDLADRSRRPHVMPRRSEAAIETQILAVRDKHPAWGARKIAHCLKRGGQTVPVPSTVHQILHRNGRVKPSENAPPNPGHRFEKEAPNLLWQMDFKGHLPLANGTRCHPLTIVDDHSRYVLCLKACADEQRLTVQDHLTATFRCYGLPEAFYTDNGSPWGDTSGIRWTGLKVWLLKLGVRVVHARPCHPQARGKNERFHRTLKAEVFAMRRFRTLTEVQRAFDAWRPLYNLERPTRASTCTSPPIASGRVLAPCRLAFQRSNTTAVRSCAGSHRQDPTFPSRDASGKFPKPSRANVSPSGRSTVTAITASSSPAGRSPRST